MSAPMPDWLAAVAPRLRLALARCAQGELPANVALMQLLGEAVDQSEAERTLAAAVAALKTQGETVPAARLSEALALWRASPRAWDIVRSVLAQADHKSPVEGGEGGARWAAVFDRLAEIAPEAAVALYSLGRPELLEAATQELVQLVRSWDLLGQNAGAVLDIGCGIGRLCAALAGEAGSVTGIDISPAMIAEARRRCAGLANVRLMRTSGHDLAPFADQSFDLVLAVDVFPYLVDPGLGLAARNVGEAARVLRPGGSLLIFNFSYHGDLAADRADLDRLARSAALDLVRNGTRDLNLWDGTAFHLCKPRPVRPMT